MKPGADHRFFYILAGETLSEMFSNYGLKQEISGETVDLSEFEDQFIDTSDGCENFDDCEAEAKLALREAEVPFAVVFRGSKIYAYVAHDKTSTFEVIKPAGVK